MFCVGIKSARTIEKGRKIACQFETHPQEEQGYWTDKSHGQRNDRGTRKSSSFRCDQRQRSCSGIFVSCKMHGTGQSHTQDGSRFGASIPPYFLVLLEGRLSGRLRHPFFLILLFFSVPAMKFFAAITVQYGIRLLVVLCLFKVPGGMSLIALFSK